MVSYLDRALFNDWAGDSKAALEDGTRAIELNPKMPQAVRRPRPHPPGRRPAATPWRIARRASPERAGSGAAAREGPRASRPGELDQAIEDCRKAYVLAPDSAWTIHDGKHPAEGAGLRSRGQGALRAAALAPNDAECHAELEGLPGPALVQFGRRYLDRAVALDARCREAAKTRRSQRQRSD